MNTSSDAPSSLKSSRGSGPLRRIIQWLCTAKNLEWVLYGQGLVLLLIGLAFVAFTVYLAATGQKVWVIALIMSLMVLAPGALVLRFRAPLSRFLAEKYAQIFMISGDSTTPPR